jgi:hypothetical protein
MGPKVSVSVRVALAGVRGRLLISGPVLWALFAMRAGRPGASLLAEAIEVYDLAAT